MNTSLVNEYKTNPTSLAFEKVKNHFNQINLQLVSLAFSVKIEVYSLSEIDFLRAMIINFKFTQKIEIFKNKSHFDSLISLKKIDNIKLCQTIISEVILKSNRIF